MDKEKRKKIFIGLGAFVALLAIYFVYEHVMYVSTDNAQVEAHAVLLASKVPGFITAVNINDGEHVKKDDVLVEIDARDYQNTLTQVRGELTSMEARRRDAERNFGRLKQLFSSGAVSQQQFDTSSSSYLEIKAKYDAISAQVAQAELNLANTKIRAPSDGFIAKRAVEVGQLAASGVPLIGFVDGGERWVSANFKETDVSDIKIGNKVYVTVDAVPGKKFVGKIAAVSAATGATFTLLPPDNATGNFTKVVQRVPVKIQLENLAADDVEDLRAGLSALVKVRK